MFQHCDQVFKERRLKGVDQEGSRRTNQPIDNHLDSAQLPGAYVAEQGATVGYGKSKSLGNQPSSAQRCLL